MADKGGCGGAAAPPLASFRKIQGLPISKIARTADSTIIIINNFYLAASSHEIFLRVGGREGMKGLGALQRHQLPHPRTPPKSATGWEWAEAMHLGLWEPTPQAASQVIIIIIIIIPAHTPTSIMRLLLHA